ncbi:MAG: DUF1501 domain-containing protein [Planctomycetaceae bacterium]|nr:DUF1501 domain-containing protein [Planctomycetaceae bacterium]
MSMSSAVTSRRELLRFGLGGFSALSLADLVRSRSEGADAGVPVKKTALILVWLHGGASHIETYDPKPQASSDYRGPFAPIATNVPGIDLCELLPEHAKVADRFTLLRSVVHTGFCHQQGTQQLLTGHPERVLRNSPLHPDVFSIAHKLRYAEDSRIPNYVSVYPVSYGGAAYLGPGYNPFIVYDDPNSEKFYIPNIGVPGPQEAARLSRRVSLRQELDLFQRRMAQLNEMDALDSHEQSAVNMLTGDAATRAFDIRSEDAATRDRYGRNRWGQQLLMARRLVEAGVDIVTTQFSGDLCGGVGNWDDHAVNSNVFEAMQYRCQFFDRAVAALIEDIYERGLDERVMVVVTGEFGRTPKINYQASTGKRIASAEPGTMQPGRDHWPRATSMLFAGGGIRTGQIIGATDQRGEDATERIVGRGDFLATIYQHLGIPYEQITFPDHSGRPQPILLSEGGAIPELIGRRG